MKKKSEEGRKNKKKFQRWRRKERQICYNSKVQWLVEILSCLPLTSVDLKVMKSTILLIVTLCLYYIQNIAAYRLDSIP